jgi:hypothetical protein
MQRNFEILDVAVVIAAEAHNPTILNPSFLTAQKVVPAGWKVDGEKVVCTPQFSAVQYERGVIFVAEPTRLQIMDKRPKGSGDKSIIPDLAKRYVLRLPHVPYTAVGINFDAFIECAEAKRIMTQRFLKPGPWSQKPLAPEAVSLTLQYPLEDSASLSFTAEATDIRKVRTGTNHSGILIKGNYHVAVKAGSSRQSVAKARKALSQFSGRCRHFMATANKVFDLKEMECR